MPLSQLRNQPHQLCEQNRRAARQYVASRYVTRRALHCAVRECAIFHVLRYVRDVVMYESCSRWDEKALGYTVVSQFSRGRCFLVLPQTLSVWNELEDSKQKRPFCFLAHLRHWMIKWCGYRRASNASYHVASCHMPSDFTLFRSRPKRNEQEKLTTTSKHNMFKTKHKWNPLHVDKCSSFPPQKPKHG